MLERDLLVAFVAFGIGFLLIGVAFFNNERAFSLRTPSYLSHSLGRTKARLIIGFVGAITVYLGVSLCTPHWINTERNNSSVPQSENDRPMMASGS